MAYKPGGVGRAIRKKKRGPGGSFTQGFAGGINQALQYGMQMGMARAMQQQQAQKDESLQYADWLSSEARSIKNPEMRGTVVTLAHQLRTGDTDMENAKNYVTVHKLFSEEAYTPPPPPEGEVERKTAKGVDNRLRYLDTGDLVFPAEKPVEITEAEWQTKMAKQLEPQRKFAEKEYARLVAMKRGDSSFQFINEQGEWETLPIQIAEWTPELKKALDFYTNQLREFGIVTSETPEPMPEDTDDLDDIIEDLLKQRRPPAIQSGMMTPGAMRKSGRKPVG